ncbi:LamG domain-containing protein [Nocardioides sp. WS12]|uniref:LamG domain-containing protein n=1 Tax=Nocardioides sp. WS12 TaxID=2486272 RepID=UPI0015F98AB2|nr:LamG domain-containing protein [Nocardioides sp. WS12]
MTYASEVAADSPVLWWRLGESSGTSAVDASGNGRHGTYAGSPTLGTAGLVTDGDTAVTFDGVDDVVTYSGTVLASSATSTIELWFYDTLGSTSLTFDVSGSTSSQRVTINPATGTVTGFVNPTGTGSATFTSATGLIATATRHQVVLRFDTGSMSVLLDGALLGGASRSGLINISAVNLGFLLGQAAFAGVFDEFSIYGTALSDARVAAHYAAGIAVGTNEVNFAGLVPQVVGSVDLETSRIARFDGIIPAVVGPVLLAPSRTVAFDGLIPSVVGSVALDNLDNVPISFAGEVPGVVGAVALAGVTESQVNRAGGWRRDNIGTATWSPAVVPSPVIGPQNAVVAQAFTTPVIDGTHTIIEPTYAYEAEHRDRLLVGGRDVSFWRGVPTPPMEYQYVQPLGWASGTFSLPQAVVPFETPGTGDLAWLKKGAPVIVQRVDTATEEVVATDYRGFVVAFSLDGGNLTVECGGHAVGRAALQDRQMQLIQYRLDSGLAMAGAIRQLRLSHVPYYGPVTGISLIRWGGGGLLDYINELSAKMTTLDGDQWTTMPNEDGVYSTYLKDIETIHGTAYLDDARVKGDLRSDLSEEPNQIFASGVAPDGMVVKFGAYPGLVAGGAAPYPMNDNSDFGIGTTNAETDTGDGIVVMGWRLNVTGFLDGRPNYNDYDAEMGEAIRALKRRAGLPVTSTMTKAAWAALFDVSKTGYTLRGIRILPAAATSEITPWRLSSNGSIIARNPGYVASTLAVHRTIAMGAGFKRTQIRQWAQGELSTGAHWRGTIEINTGAIIAGEHTPGDPIASILRARDIRPGMNIWLPLFAGGILVHVAGVSVRNEGHTVMLAVDTRPGDTMPVWAAIQRDRENRNTVHRSFFAQRRSADLERENTFDEVGGTIPPIKLNPDDWTVFPVPAKQAGTIERIRLSLSPNREFVMAVFGREITAKRLRAVTNAPLTLAGRKRWTETNVYNKLNRSYVVNYVAGSDEDPCGYFPGRKSDDGTLTGIHDDPASFPFLTFMNNTDRGNVLWVAVWVGASATLDGGRIMWPSAEEY